MELTVAEVVGVWRPTLGITADPAVAAAWREAGVAVLVAPER